MVIPESSLTGTITARFVMLDKQGRRHNFNILDSISENVKRRLTLYDIQRSGPWIYRDRSTVVDFGTVYFCFNHSDT